MDGLHRRTFLALLGAPLLAALLEACGHEKPTAAVVGSSHSELSRSATTATDAPGATVAVNDFGISLYRQLAVADATGNIVMSPASIAIALTMTAAGARGVTLDEMIATLHIADPTTIHHSMNALTAQLDALSHGDVQLSIANSLWGQSDLTFQQQFLDLLAGEYGAGMELVAYHADAESARLAINEWVADETHERIPELLQRGIIDRDTKLVLANAIYLKAAWAQQFAVASTADAPFTTGEGDVVQVPTMARTTRFAYATGDGWQAVELPYAGSSLAMLIFLPEEGFLPLFEEIFLITDATEYLEPRQVRLQMPRFDIESSFSLKDQLVQLGMPTAFSDGADFSGMTTETALRIAAVVHQANITVTEEGTEAAAATAVVMEPTSAPADEPIELVIDRPFVFVLRDTATEAVLFVGRVSDPRG
jgi:serpin B